MESNQSMLESILEEAKRNPILSLEESQPMSSEELFDEEDFLQEIAIIDSIAEQYAEEKDKSKVRSLINEALEKRRVLRESVNK